MAKGKQRHIVTHVVTLELMWPEDKWEIIHILAEKNKLSLADMVDTILDDWAALANHELGNTSVPRVLKSIPAQSENGR